MYYRLIAATLFALIFSACGSGSTAEAVREYDQEGMGSGSPMSLEADYSIEEEPNLEIRDQASPAPAPPPNAAATTPKIIYTASARGRVAQLDSALARITRRVAAAGGYLSSQHRNNSNYEYTASLVIRLPADQLSPTLGFLKDVTEEIDYQNLESKDITAEWLDLESRLQTKRDVRDRYIDILRNKAKKVEDILNAEDKIRVITEEIEAKEGRLRYLRDQVSLSTLTLDLYETREYRDVGPVTTRSFGSEFVASLSYGWELVRNIFLGLVSIWPILILTVFGIWGVRRWVKK